MASEDHRPLRCSPHYEESPKSGLITRFPIAEQTTEEQATWHRGYSSGKSAERIRNVGLAKGDKVKVDGHRQERDYKKQGGSSVKQEVIFAVHVKKLRESGRMEATHHEQDEGE